MAHCSGHSHVPPRELCPHIVGRADQPLLVQGAAKDHELAEADGPCLLPNPAESRSVEPRLSLEGGWTRLAGRRKQQQQQQQTYSSRAEKALHLWLCITERVWSRAQYAGRRACPARRLAAGGLRVGLIPKLAEAMLPPKLDIPATIPYDWRVYVGGVGIGVSVVCQRSLVIAGRLSRDLRHLVRKYVE